MSDSQPPQQPQPTAARRLTPGSNAPPSELNSAELIRRRLFEKEPAEIYPTPRFARYSRMANWVVLPSVILYCVFFVEFGSHEHVFSPPRRWLDRQKAKFWSLSPAEQSLARENAAQSVQPPKDDAK